MNRDAIDHLAPLLSRALCTMEDERHIFDALVQPKGPGDVKREPPPPAPVDGVELF